MQFSPTDELTPRQQKALATKARIAEVAMQLFSEQGFAATSTKQIAKAADVSEGLIFRYYPTKLELLRSLSRSRQTLSGEVGALLEDMNERPARECLAVIARSFVRLMRSEAPFLNMMLGESRTNDELYTLFSGIVESTSSTLAEYLDRRIQAGELRPDLATQGAARAFLGPFVLFFMTNKHLSGEAWAERSERYADEVLDLWFKGALRGE